MSRPVNHYSVLVKLPNSVGKQLHFKTSHTYPVIHNPANIFDCWQVMVLQLFLVFCYKPQ